MRGKTGKQGQSKVYQFSTRHRGSRGLGESSSQVTEGGTECRGVVRQGDHLTVFKPLGTEL